MTVRDTYWDYKLIPHHLSFIIRRMISEVLIPSK